MKKLKKRFYSVHRSKKYPGKHRIVEWYGKHPNIGIEIIEDNLTYGQAVIKKEEL
jgi:hypothetical protein